MRFSTKLFLSIVFICFCNQLVLSQSENRNASTPPAERVYKPSEVTTKAKVLSRPEPNYTDEARKNELEGTVRLKVVLAATGKVTNIKVADGLPMGLTEKCVEAARKLKFKPAVKDGNPVSQYATIEYNFRLFYRDDQVTRQAVILSKPAPDYPEEARNAGVRGRVELLVALSKTGGIMVMDIIQSMPNGLTEKAIEAAGKIKFTPAEKDGRPVSVIKSIEYNFPPH